MDQANCIKEYYCIDDTCIYNRKWLYCFCKGKQSESVYLIGEQRQTFHILVNQKNFPILANKHRGYISKEMDSKRSKCEKLRKIRRTVKVNHVDTAAELIPHTST